jgi:translation initiation factor 1
VADDRPFHNPFSVLSSLKKLSNDPPESESPPAPESADSSTRAPSAGACAAPRIARAVVRMERTGRGGKEVTVVEQLGLPSRDREAWLKALKAQLGCGGVVEGESLVLQGDHRKRLPAMLTARGVKKVTIG